MNLTVGSTIRWNERSALQNVESNGLHSRLDGLHSNSLNQTVYTPTEQIQWSALRIVVFAGLHDKQKWRPV